MKTFTIQPLTLDHLEEISGYWLAAHPNDPMTTALLRERLFGPSRLSAPPALPPHSPPAFDPELILGARNGAGELIGIGAGVYPTREEGIGGIRWLGAAPDCRGEGIERALADELCRRLAARGARECHLMATPPYYIRPGVDIRNTDLISEFLAAGWTHQSTHFNMSLDLSAWNPPDESRIFGPDREGYLVRRAHFHEHDTLKELILREWSVGWSEVTPLGLEHDPISVFVAELQERLVGFAAYEVDQCLGAFGPTGVDPLHQGHGLGRRLLWATLVDMKHLGRQTVQIGWVGPVGFYHRSCGAQLGPTFWLLTKSVGLEQGREEGKPHVS